jgi:pyruvate/2-oxoglutarate dehydrogenase complex dihydrolipoamide dehydrogenase (E3) component
MKAPKQRAASRAPAIRARGKSAPLARPAPRRTRRYDFAVIGAGPAGLTAAVTAARAGKRVILFEAQRIGGTSLNTGSIPSKALIRSATLFAAMREVTRLRGSTADVPVADLARIAARLRKIEERIAGTFSLARLARSGVEVCFAAARFADRDTLVADSSYIRFGKAIVATGAMSAPPNISGLANDAFLTSETIFGLTQLPETLAVVGGGPLGCELAQAFCRLGSKVTIIQDEAEFLPREERDAAQILARAMARDGVSILLNTRVVGARRDATGLTLETQSYKTTGTVPANSVLVSVGRIPNVSGLNLDGAQVAYDPANGVAVDDFLRTSNANVFAAGDVCMPYKYTYVAERTARIAVQNALRRRPHLRYTALTIPWCTFCAPEVAHVGLQVWEARQRSIPIKTYTVIMQDVDRAITDREDNGFVKLHTAEGDDRILGATIVASHASEMINEVCVAMRSGVGLRSLAQVMHTYPAQSDAIRLAAMSLEDPDPRI